MENATIGRRLSKAHFLMFLVAIALAFVGTPASSAANEGLRDGNVVEAPPPVDPVEDAVPVVSELEGADLPVETEFDLNDPEVTQYAGHYGVDLERALEIAIWVDAGGLYVDNLPEMLEGNWADSQLIHGGGRGGPLDDPTMEPGQLRLEIFLADSRAAEAIDVIGQIPELDGMLIEIIDVPLSRVELDALAADLVVPDGMMVEYNVRAGTVEIVPRTDHEIAVDTPRTVEAPELP